MDDLVPLFEGKNHMVAAGCWIHLDSKLFLCTPKSPALPAFVTPKPHSVNDPGPTPTPDPHQGPGVWAPNLYPPILHIGTIRLSEFTIIHELWESLWNQSLKYNHQQIWILQEIPITFMNFPHPISNHIQKLVQEIPWISRLDFPFGFPVDWNPQVLGHFGRVHRERSIRLGRWDHFWCLFGPNGTERNGSWCMVQRYIYQIGGKGGQKFCPSFGSVYYGLLWFIQVISSWFIESLLKVYWLMFLGSLLLFGFRIARFRAPDLETQDSAAQGLSGYANYELVTPCNLHDWKSFGKWAEHAECDASWCSFFPVPPIFPKQSG